MTVVNPDRRQADGLLTVNNPTPVISSVTATSTTLGASGVVITLKGIDFLSGATASFLGVPYPIIGVGASVRFGPVTLPDTGQEVSFTVANAAPTLGQATASLAVPWPAVTVTGASLSTSAAGAFNAKITIQGTNFVPGVMVTLPPGFWPSGPVAPTSRTATQLEINAVTLPPTPGTYTLAVQNPAPSGGPPGSASVSVLKTIAGCSAEKAANPSTQDGLYLVASPAGGAGPVVPTYCDMTTDGGGWMLAAKFSQHQSIQHLPQATYDAYFKNNLWIQGYADRTPESPVGAYDGYHIESHNWARFLVKDNAYRLRQNLTKNSSPSNIFQFDVSYQFTYNGYTVQNASLNDAHARSNRTWELTDRKVNADSTAAAYKAPKRRMSSLPATVPFLHSKNRSQQTSKELSGAPPSWYRFVGTAFSAWGVGRGNLCGSGRLGLQCTSALGPIPPSRPRGASKVTHTFSVHGISLEA